MVFRLQALPFFFLAPQPNNRGGFMLCISRVVCMVAGCPCDADATRLYAGVSCQ